MNKSAEEQWEDSQKAIEKNRRLKKLAKDNHGKIAYDSQFGTGIHVSAFHFIKEDGTHIYEWP